MDWTSDSFLTSLDMRWLDTKFRLRGEQVPGNEVLIVGIDDRTMDNFGSARTFERYHAARLIDQRAAASPRVIDFDIFFQDPDSSDPENDRLFAEAIERARNVVMAVSIDLESSVGERREVQELPSDFQQIVIEKGVFPATRNGQNQSGKVDLGTKPSGRPPHPHSRCGRRRGRSCNINRFKRCVCGSSRGSNRRGSHCRRNTDQTRRGRSRPQCSARSPWRTAGGGTLP